MNNFPFDEAELKILDFIRDNLGCAFLDCFMKIVTRFGYLGIFWIATALVLVFTKKYRKTGIAMGVALILGLAIGNGVIKNIFDRMRPYDFKEGMRELLIVKPEHDSSFPSGHSLACFEAATVLMLTDKKLGIPALVIAILVALSRMYLYVHYPTDVLAGSAFGVLFGFAGYYIVEYAVKTYKAKKAAKE